MSHAPILADSNDTPQIETHLANDDQTVADYGVLDAAEMDRSKYVNARFYRARVQVPNSYVVDSEGRSEAIMDHTNPAFKEFDMVCTTTPEPKVGTPTVTHQYVTDFHIKRWPDRWKAYKSGQTQGADGVPLTELTSIPTNAITSLQAAGVFTIEQLARHSSAGSVIHNGNVFQAAARRYLSEKEGNKTQELEDQIAELKAQMAEFLAASKAKATK